MCEKVRKREGELGDKAHSLQELLVALLSILLAKRHPQLVRPAQFDQIQSQLAGEDLGELLCILALQPTE